ncbi:MAG: class I SAM-dependent methyltransferase [Desulfobacula sp.]
MLEAMMKIDFDFWRSIKGFMDEEEAKRLYLLSLEAAERGPVLEIGSYCGKSAYIIGSAAKKNNSTLYSIDHHRGSEEQQPGQEYFDRDLFDPGTQSVNTFPFFRKTLEKAGLEDIVIPVVASSEAAGKMWQTPLSMVFIDGGHSFEASYSDYLTWACHIKPGGFLVIHDIFDDPEKGGQAPRRVYEAAIFTNDYEILEMTKTLGVLKRK